MAPLVKIIDDENIEKQKVHDIPFIVAGYHPNKVRAAIKILKFLIFRFIS